MIRTRHAGLRHPEEGAPAWAQSGGSETSAKALLAPTHGKEGSGGTKRGGDIKQWCYFHKGTTHSDADCRTQHAVGSANADNANHAANYIDHPISFTEVEAPTEEEAFWPFGPKDKPVDTSGLFGSFGGGSGEETDDLLFMVEEEPAQQLGFREHIVGGLTAMTRALVMVAILHYLWLSFGNSLYARVAKKTYGQPEVFGGITNTEDGSAITIGPTERPRTSYSNDSVNALVDSGASGYYFDDAIIPGFRDRLEEYKILDVPQKFSTAGGGGLNGTAQGVLRGHVVDDKGCEFTSKEFQRYCLQTGVSLEYAGTNTPQQIGRFKRVGITLAAMVRCMLADSGLPKILWGELMFMEAFLGSRVPHSAIGMQSPYEMLPGTELDLSLLRVIGARTFVHIESYSKKLELKAVKGRPAGYSNSSKNYHVYNPETRRIMQSRNVIFIDTPKRLSPPPSEETSQQVNPPSNGIDNHN